MSGNNKHVYKTSNTEDMVSVDVIFDVFRLEALDFHHELCKKQNSGANSQLIMDSPSIPKKK